MYYLWRVRKKNLNKTLGKKAFYFSNHHRRKTEWCKRKNDNTYCLCSYIAFKVYTWTKFIFMNLKIQTKTNSSTVFIKINVFMFFFFLIIIKTRIVMLSLCWQNQIFLPFLQLNRGRFFRDSLVSRRVLSSQKRLYGTYF